MERRSDDADWIPKLGDWLGLSAKLGLLYGGAWLFAYCFFSVGFFPSGLAAADGLFLIFVAGGFGFVATFIAAIGQYVVSPLMHTVLLFSKERKAQLGRFSLVGRIAWIASLVLLITLAVMCFIEGAFQHWSSDVAIIAILISYPVATGALWRYLWPEKGWETAIAAAAFALIALVIMLMLLVKAEWWGLQSIVIQGVLASILVSIWTNPRFKDQRRQAIPIFVALNLGAPIYLAIMDHSDRPLSPTMAITFERLGLYRPAADLLVSNGSAEQLRQLTAQHGLALPSCRLDEKSLFVSHVQVLWHGVGNRVLIRLNGPGASSKLSVHRLELDASDVRVLDPLPQQCAEVPTVVHFGSGSDQPIDPGEIDALIDGVTAARQAAPKHWLLAEIRVRGHADPMPSEVSSNLALGRARARVVADVLAKRIDGVARPDAGGPKVLVDSSAARESLGTACPAKGDAPALAECHARSRRVEVQLLFRQPPPSKDKAA